MRWRSVCVLALLAGVWSVANAGTTDHDRLFTRSHAAMGTGFTLYMYAASAAIADREADRAFAIVDELEALLSNYQAQSELSRINREAASHAVTTDPETFRFIEASLAWSARSQGAFDITVGPLMKAWGFFRSRGRIPTQAELDELRNVTGWRHVVLDPAARTVRFTRAGVGLDPGGIGKGFAVDAAMKALREDGVQRALLSAGSSTIYALGAPRGEMGWKVRVPSPWRHDGTLSTITLRDSSLSTANCSEKHFVVAGHLYCHIMDPRTLRPVEDCVQATVTAPSATDSDALSNAVFVLSGRQRRRLMRALPVEDEALVALPGKRVEAFRWSGTIPGSGRGIVNSEAKESTN